MSTAVAETDQSNGTLSISEVQAQEILNYLVGCPYAQVHHLVGYLLAAQPHKEDRD
jgi:hypothetical protein